MVRALWLKSGSDPSVEMIAGIDDLQVWFLVAEDINPVGKAGYFQAGQLPQMVWLLGCVFYCAVAALMSWLRLGNGLSR